MKSRAYPQGADSLGLAAITQFPMLNYQRTNEELELFYLSTSTY